jgi:hypothetical protein
MAKIEGMFERALAVRGPTKLIVRTGSGDVQLSRGEEDKVLVRAHFVVRALRGQQAQDLAEKIKADPPIEVVGNTITIGDLSKYAEGGLWFFPSIAMDFEIEAPYETEAELDSGSGDQRIRGIRGPVRAEAGSGDLEITGIEREVTARCGLWRCRARADRRQHSMRDWQWGHSRGLEGRGGGALAVGDQFRGCVGNCARRGALCHRRGDELRGHRDRFPSDGHG